MESPFLVFYWVTVILPIDSNLLGIKELAVVPISIFIDINYIHLSEFRTNEQSSNSVWPMNIAS